MEFNSEDLTEDGKGLAAKKWKGVDLAEGVGDDDDMDMWNEIEEELKRDEAKQMMLADGDTHASFVLVPFYHLHVKLF